MSVLDTLVTDRSESDVEYLRSLLRKGWQNLSADEKTEYLSGALKGAYNYTDMNRVEAAVAYVAAELYAAHATLQAYATSLGVAWDNLFDVPYNYTDYQSLTTKTDWDDEDIMYVADATRYLGNLVLIAAAYETDIALPSSMNGLDYIGANAIERLLIAIDEVAAATVENIKTLIDNTAAEWFYSGELYAGEI